MLLNFKQNIICLLNTFKVRGHFSFVFAFILFIILRNIAIVFQLKLSCVIKILIYHLM